jgi:predicted nucleotidyltransferase component of viral defense system
VNKTPPQNIAASVHQRLLNKARETNRSFSELVQYFAMERFLYRLSKSTYADKFILKGALMLAVWKAPLARPTMDIDMLGQGDNSMEVIVDMIRNFCRQAVEPDGIIFDAGSVSAARITEDADYEGVRVKLRGRLDTVRITIQIDIGFGDVVVPKAKTIIYPTILDLPKPHLIGYSRESTVAEKFEAMVKLGILNSRMKDFFDIWFLSRQFDFTGKTLEKAIKTTFSIRSTGIPTVPTAFTPDFSRDPTKDAQWKAFIRKNRLINIPKDFHKIIADVTMFLRPVVESITSKRPFHSSWKAPGPWK